MRKIHKNGHTPPRKCVPRSLVIRLVAACDLCADDIQANVSCRSAETHLILFIVHERQYLIYQGRIVVHRDHMDGSRTSCPFFSCSAPSSAVQTTGSFLSLASENITEDEAIEAGSADNPTADPCRTPDPVTQIDWPRFQERWWSEYVSFDQRPLLAAHETGGGLLLPLQGVQQKSLPIRLLQTIERQRGCQLHLRHRILERFLQSWDHCWTIETARVEMIVSRVGTSLSVSNME